MARFTCCAQSFRRLKIQRSSMGTSPFSSASGRYVVEILRHPRLHARALHVHEEETRGVPDLVGERARAFHALFGEHDVGAGRGALQQGHADGVGAVLLGHHQRVDHVALGLRHLLALGVAHQGVNVDLVERHFAHEFHAHHDHARHPEEQNVEAGDQQRSRIERARSSVSSGQPSVENGHRPELNQVSSTSVSCTSSSEPQRGQARASRAPR